MTRVPEVEEKWAYREKAKTAGEPLHPVEVIKKGPHRTNKIKVRWLSGEFEGLEQWVPAVRLVVPWDEHQALLDEEASSMSLAAMQPEPLDDITCQAVQDVGFSLDLPCFFWRDKSGALEMQIEESDTGTRALPPRIAELLESPGAYTDRDGIRHVGQEAALQAAKLLCQVYSPPAPDFFGHRFGVNCPEEVIDAKEELRRRPILGQAQGGSGLAGPAR